jgi:hypothetical protein
MFKNLVSTSKKTQRLCYKNQSVTDDDPYSFWQNETHKNMDKVQSS